MPAVNETAAHLDVLVARGWVSRASVDGVNRYARCDADAPTFDAGDDRVSVPAPKPA